MDQNRTPEFHVGYDNGYGYAPDAQAQPVQDPAFVATVSVPAVELAALAAAQQDQAPGDAAPRSSNRWVVRSLVLGALAFVVLIGAVAVLVIGRSGGTSVAAASTSATKAKAATTGTRVDEHGDLIADSITILPPSSVPDVTTTAPTEGTSVLTTPVTAPAPSIPVPVTAPATTPPTTAPTVPPTTAPPTTSTTAPTTTSTTAPVLKIATFNHPSSVSCANPANQVPSIPLSWTTQNAVKVTISIDGPGIYKTYLGASGNDTFPFSCPGPHTYLITAYSATNQATSQQVVIAKA